ncbi:MAG: hypothetical protein ACYC6Y_16505 [Thermoguttaceae bacterium]
MCKSRLGWVVVPITVLAAAGQSPRAAAAGADGLQIASYDVGDLILDVPDYPYPGSMNAGSLFGGSGGASPAMGGMGMGGMGGGMGGMGMGGDGGGGDSGSMAQGDAAGYSGSGSSLAGQSSRITIEDLKRVILAVISPDTWIESGGVQGELQQLGTTLVVRQTAEVHQQIGDLLDQLRQGSGEQKTVSVDARWLLLNSDELEQMMPEDSQGRRRIVGELLNEFTRRPTSFRGLTSCFTGQLVYLVSGTRRNVVTSFVPVVGSVERPLEREYAVLAGGARVVAAQATSPGRSVGYQPVINTPNLGVLLQLRPTLVPGQARAVVDVRSTLTALGAPLPETVHAGPMGEDSLVPKVDRVAIETQELATTLSVPLGEPVLAGGLTYVGPSAEWPRDGSAGEGDNGSAEAPQLYLVLELK